MNIQQSFYTLFYLLDQLYEQTQNQELASLLGDLNPFLFENSSSSDPAIFEIFSEIWEQRKLIKLEDLESLKVAQECLLTLQEAYSYNYAEITTALTLSAWQNAAQIVCSKFPAEQ